MLYDDADKQAPSAAHQRRRQGSTLPSLSPSRATARPDGLPVHSFQSLLADLATLARNTLATAFSHDHEFVLHTTPTAIQQKALDLLGVNVIKCTQ
jgi:hypothetical protein